MDGGVIAYDQDIIAHARFDIVDHADVGATGVEDAKAHELPDKPFTVRQRARRIDVDAEVNTAQQRAIGCGRDLVEAEQHRVPGAGSRGAHREGSGAVLGLELRARGETARIAADRLSTHLAAHAVRAKDLRGAQLGWSEGTAIGHRRSFNSTCTRW